MTSTSSFAALDRFVAALEHRIQAAIAPTLPAAAPTIRCRFQQGRLLVLSEDTVAAATATERDERFKALALAMGTGLAATELPAEFLDDTGELPVRLYLRKRGTASPYAARSWGWQPVDDTADGLDAAGDAALDSSEPAMEGTAGALVLLSRDAEPAAAAPEPEVAAEDAAVSPAETTSDAATGPFWQSWQARLASAPWQDRWQQLTTHWQALPWRSVGGLVVAGVAVGVVTYGVSRPCLVGRCERRQTASDLSLASVDQLQGRPTPDEVTSAHQDLQKAIRLVSAIPPWSSHYDAAQADLLRYRTQLADLEWILAAQRDATEASEKSQDPPHPVPLWVEVHLLWQKAVTHLGRVPADSPLAAFAQTKQREYEANYQAIGDRLAIEEQAEANLNEALQAAQLATAQTETATTLTEWLVAQRAWNQATQALSNIPQGTLAYQEARSLLSDYRSQMVQTRTRVTFEQAGERAYQDALADAAQAQAAERNDQWTQAVSHWSEAFAQMRQVPKNTLRYAEAQGQLATYQASLKQAQTKLRQAVALQTIDDDLANLCPTTAGVCTYTYGRQGIELTLREPYDSAIRQSISPPSTQSQLSRNDAVMAETHELVQNIMQLGNQVQLPIAVYDGNRQFIARYKPEFGGFSRN
ncbi:MAG: hypothetical protein ACFB12_02480 [Leptolyngbyaceae cyanobacterium]